jgi:hypothetical protein
LVVDNSEVWEEIEDEEECLDLDGDEGDLNEVVAGEVLCG